MSPRTSLLALAGAVTLVVAAHPRAQTLASASRLADTRIPGSPILSLELPANDATTSGAIPRVLGAAGVPYGFEGVALPAGAPALDFATPITQATTLSGLTVGVALDAIARANARVRWKEENGGILVRMMPEGEGLLDQRLSRFVVVNAPPRVILETLLKAIDPARPSGASVNGMGRPAAGREDAAPTRRGKNVTIALDRPTVLDVLQTVSRENGALSWSVTYAQAPASGRTARIELRESGEVTIGEPSDATMTGVVVPIGVDVVYMLVQYAAQVPVALGVEQILPTSAPAPRKAAALPSLYLGGVPTRDAIARIVAHDSRYEWSEDRGVFHVRPKRNTPGRPTLLDRTLPGVAALRQPLKDVVAAVVSNLAKQPPAPSSSLTLSEDRAALEAIGARPVDVSIAGPVTIREALDGICRAAGGLSWVLRGRLPLGDAVFYNLQVLTPTGAVVSISFFLRDGLD